MSGYYESIETVIPKRELIVGLDLGQARDWTAWTVAERTKIDDGPATYNVRHIDRIRNVSYPQVVSHTAALVRALRGPEPRWRQIDQRPSVHLVCDYTGVGRPVADLLTEANLDVPMQLVSITGADQTTRGESGDWRVPKRVLASTVQVGLQTGRLTIEKALAMADILSNELRNFKVKISLTGHDSYGAGDEWREASHDDLVLSLALAVWWGEHRPAGWDEFDTRGLVEWFRNAGVAVY